MEYNCKECKYSTNYNSNYKKHIRSQKHIHNCLNNEKSETIQCPQCDMSFANKPNFYRHRRTNVCKKQQVHDDLYMNEHDKIKKLENELFEERKNNAILKDEENKRLKEELALKNQIILEHSKERAELVSIVKRGGVTLSKSMSAINYLKTHLSDAPVLTKIDESKYVEIAEPRHSVAQTVVHFYANNKLVEHLGEKLIKFHKNDIPKLNSIWATDMSRYTFYYMNEESNWEMDKIATKISNIIIAPMLDFVHKELKVYNRIENKLTKKAGPDMEEHWNNNNNGQSIVNDIESKFLHWELVKFIAPHFQFDMCGKNLNNEVKQIENKNDKNDELKKSGVIALTHINNRVGFIKRYDNDELSDISADDSEYKYLHLKNYKKDKYKKHAPADSDAISDTE
jgi:hypothetical protein